jgi:hypothetical protein
MLVPNSKEVNEILLLKRDQHGCRPHHCKSRIKGAVSMEAGLALFAMQFHSGFILLVGTILLS